MHIYIYIYIHILCMYTCKYMCIYMYKGSATDLPPSLLMRTYPPFVRFEAGAYLVRSS